MRTDITVLDRRDLIRLALDVHVAVCATPGPLFHVELPDLPVWMELLDCDHCWLHLRRDSSVEVDAVGTWEGKPVHVCTTAGEVRGVVLPPVPEGRVTSPEATSLPVGELWRLESLRKAAAS